MLPAERRAKKFPRNQKSLPELVVGLIQDKCMAVKRKARYKRGYCAGAYFSAMMLRMSDVQPVKGLLRMPRPVLSS